MTTPSRRLLMAQAAALAGVALTPAAWTSAVAQTRLADDPFTLGVASGEPEPQGVVLWTRLAPRPLEPDGGMGRAPVQVRWEVAADDGFRHIVARGRELAVAEAAHSIHAEVFGLKPDRAYWYRFTAGGQVSPIGRTRTAPAPGAAIQRVRMAFSSCQKYEAGYYAAHRAMAAEAPDLILFLGDYIYEGATGLGVRRHPPVEAHDLATYRTRYGLYKSDPDLQASHAAAPWMVIWDDHEVANDYGDDQDRSNPDPAAFLARRAAAYQAYFEHMPLRRHAQPVGPQMQLYRSLDWGRLAQIQFTDTRQHRNHRTCEAQSDGKRIPADCAERTDPTRSILGAAQERWLTHTLAGSRAKWNVLAQPYLMGELTLEDGRHSNDGWDGYDQTRRRLLTTWRDAKVANPVALGGDIHCFFAGDLALERGARPIASEFVGGSISSLGRDNVSLAHTRTANPHLTFAEGERRGYGLIDLMPKTCSVTFRAVENALRANSPVGDLARFVVEDGRAGVQRA